MYIKTDLDMFYMDSTFKYRTVHVRLLQYDSTHSSVIAIKGRVESNSTSFEALENSYL